MMFAYSIGIAGGSMVRLTILPACLRCIGIPTARRRVEQPLPNCHHSTLLESGVVGYDRAALTEDYRLAVSLAGSHTHSASDVEYPARFIDAPGARFGFV